MFYENKCSEKCPENPHTQRLREDSFVEPEAERETTGVFLVNYLKIFRANCI